MSRMWIAFLLMILSLGSPNECRANESGWLVNDKSPAFGKVSSYISPTGIKSTYNNQGYVIVTAAPEWKVVVYNDDSKTYFKTTIKDYARELTSAYAAVGLHDIDVRLWSKPQTCLFNGRAALKYTYRAKKADAFVQSAECWFAKDVPVPTAFAQFSAEINRVPCDPHLLLRLVRHRAGDSAGDVTVDVKSVTKTTIPPNCYSYPKNYRLADNFLQVEMGNLGKDLIDEMSR
jgi:hypothetical protein